MNQPFKDQIALVTGASRGIGRAIALRLADMGAHIVVNYVRNQEAAQEVVSLIQQKGVKAFHVQANVGDHKALDEMVKTAVLQFGAVDIVVHSAALGAFKPAHLLKINQWELSMDVNAKAFYLLAQKTIPLMAQRGGGSIIGISSLGSHRIIPNYGAIGVSKAALETLVKYLAFELAPKNIRVNCVSGGLVDTDALKFFPGYEAFKEEVVKRTPAGRIGQPDDLAKVVGFLASPDAAWITGQTIIADGGLSLI
jgi:enoyl-[acyl-carrier protein] reductase III